MKRYLYPSTHEKKAFTLIEVLIVALIIPLIFAVIFMLTKAGNEIYGTVTVSMDIRQSARNAMERIIRETRESNGSVVMTISADADRVSFTTPRFKDINGVLVPIAYYLDTTNGQVVREYPPNTLTPVAADVKQLKFFKTGPQLDITIRTEKMNNTMLLTYAIKQKVRLRNE